MVFGIFKNALSLHWQMSNVTIEVGEVQQYLHYQQRESWPRWRPTEDVILVHCSAAVLTHMGIFPLTGPEIGTIVYCKTILSSM